VLFCHDVTICDNLFTIECDVLCDILTEGVCVLSRCDNLRQFIYN
jgi:hypothetical protein